MSKGRMPFRFRYSLRGMAILVVGLSIGLSVGLKYSPFRKMAPNEAHTFKTPDYVIEPPDILAIEIASPNRPDAKLSGEFLVGPDGTITIGQIGRIYITGLTVSEVNAKLQRAARKGDEDATAKVRVAKFNSKKYYIIVSKSGLDNISVFPFTGDDFVLDALANVGSDIDASKKDIWISRPSAMGTKNSQNLIVDYEAITKGADPLSNYQLLPGDRLFVTSKPLPDTARL